MYNPIEFECILWDSQMFLMLEKNFTTLCSDVQGGFYFQNRILRTFERGSAENDVVSRVGIYYIYYIVYTNS